MRNLLNPKWIFIINTIPILILGMICWSTYSIIHTLLPEESLVLWQQFAIGLAVLAQASLIFGVVKISQKKQLNAWYGVFTFLFYIPFLYFYLQIINDFVPRSVPRWMVSEDFFFYPYSFIMPTLLHALLVLVAALTPNETTRNPWFDFLACLLIPCGFYLITAVITPLLNHGYSTAWGEYVLIVLTVVLTTVFLFFFSRGIFVLYKNKLSAWKVNALFWKIPVGIFFPIGGLALNDSWEVFGDFSHPLFYVLAGINGVAFCLPDAKKKSLRFAQFVARAILFPYIIYFFLVFIPYLPLSVIAIVLVGTGFLMLTPLMLFVLQSKQLADDFSYLKQGMNTRFLTLIIVGSFAILPLGITISYQQDKAALYDGLDYLYESSLAAESRPAVHAESLKRVLAQIRKNQQLNSWERRDLSQQTVPFLTTYYNWLVLDNLSISAQKIALMERVFLGETQGDFRASRFIRPNNEGVELTNATVNSEYDQQTDSWKSTIELSLTNQNIARAFSEYTTTFELPTGAWISDYYLWIEDRKEHGILAEKKAATWIYNQITQTRRDPGILHYTRGNEVAFKVYPFLEGEIRKTGFELIHKEPIQLKIDGFLLELGNAAEQESIVQPITIADDVVYLSARAKQDLPKTTREPYIHFMVDCSSKATRKSFDNAADHQAKLVGKFLNNTERFSLVNSEVETFSLEQEFEAAYRNKKLEGGFFLERALKKDMYANVENPKNSYPIYVVISDHIDQAIWTEDLAEFAAFHPETKGFYHLQQDSISFYSFDRTIMGERVENMEIHAAAPEVYVYPNQEEPKAYFATTAEAAILLRNTDVAFDANVLGEKSWKAALYLQGLWQSQLLHPEQGTARWRELVKGSFMNQTMSPVTAFIALEDEAQKAMLKKKQEQALSGKKSLDLDVEDVNQMSEPEWWLLAALLLGVWGIKRLKQRHYSSS